MLNESCVICTCLVKLKLRINNLNVEANKKFGPKPNKMEYRYPKLRVIFFQLIVFDMIQSLPNSSFKKSKVKQ